jgi:hypothetical protein
MCFIREYDFTNAYVLQKRQMKNLKKQNIFTHTFLNIDESKNLTILKYTSHSNPNTPFSISKPSKTIIFLNSQLFIIC